MKDIIRAASHLVLGTAAAQIISLFFLPVIARTYSPSDFGGFATILVAVGLMSIISTLQLAQAIVIPTLESHARSIARLSLAGALAGGMGTTLCVLPVAVQYSDYPLLLAIMCGAAVSSAGTFMTLQGLSVRAKSFVCVGTASTTRALVLGGSQLSASFYWPNEMGLLVGYIAGELAACWVLWKWALPDDMKDLRLRSWLEARVILRRYNDFATYGTAMDAMNAASHGVPVLLLSAYFGQAIAGFYSFAMRIVLAPGQLVANAVRQVLSQRFARSYKQAEVLRHEFYLSTIGLAVPAILGAVAIGPFLPDLFGFVLGNEWRGSGDYARWLILWVAFLVFNVPASIVMRVARKQRENLILNILILASRVAVLVAGGLWFTPLEAVAAFALLGALWNVVYILMARRHLPVAR